MLRLIGTRNIPDWGVNYLVNGDTDGLTDKEIQELDNFYQNIMTQYNATRVIFDTSVMDIEKYGYYFYLSIDPYIDLDPYLEAGHNFDTPSMLEEYANLRLPVYVDIDGREDTLFNIVVCGYNLSKDKEFECHVFQDQLFFDEDEAKLFMHTYYGYLADFNVYVHETDKSIIHIWE